MKVPNVMWICNNYTVSHLCNIPIERTIYGIEKLQRMLTRKTKGKYTIHKDELNCAIEKGRSWLENLQRRDGSIGDREYRQWDIWYAANAVLALIETNGNKDCIDKACNFIHGGQLKNGAFYFSYLPKCDSEDVYQCPETTGIALLAIYKNEKKLSDSMKKGIDYYIKEQRQDGSWECAYFLRPWISKFPSATGWGLKTLLYLQACPEKTLKKALSFLEATQKNDGSWGGLMEYHTTEGYAIKHISDALILARNEECLTTEEKEKIDIMLQKCFTYVKKRQNWDGSWSAFNCSKSLSTALYLQTLLNLTDKKNEEIMGLIIDGAHFLIEHQEMDGFWHGGKLGKYDEYGVITTCESLIALSMVLKCMESKL